MNTFWRQRKMRGVYYGDVALILEEIQDVELYEHVVAGMPITSPLQGWGFGRTRELTGTRPMRYLIKQRGSVVGAMQLLRRKLAPGVTVLYAPRGPVVDSPERLLGLADAIRSVKRPSDVWLMIEPPMPIVDDGSPLPERIGPFERCKPEQPEHTIMVDLHKSEAELMAELQSMARRNLKQSVKAGVTARRDDDLEAFLELHRETNARADLHSQPDDYYRNLLAEVRRAGSEAYLIMVRLDGVPLAGGLFLGMGDTTNYIFGGSVREARDAQGQLIKDPKASDAFYWHSILDAKEHGYRYLDLWGIPSTLVETKHAYGVYKMKAKFCRDMYWFPGYRLPLSPLARPLDKAREIVRKRRGAKDVL